MALVHAASSYGCYDMDIFSSFSSNWLILWTRFTFCICFISFQMRSLPGDMRKKTQPGSAVYLAPFRILM